MDTIDHATRFWTQRLGCKKGNCVKVTRNLTHLNGVVNPFKECMIVVDSPKWLQLDAIVIKWLYAYPHIAIYFNITKSFEENVIFAKHVHVCP